jgi:hypothetical protein
MVSLLFAAILVNCAPSGEMHNYCTPHIVKENLRIFSSIGATTYSYLKCIVCDKLLKPRQSFLITLYYSYTFWRHLGLVQGDLAMPEFKTYMYMWRARFGRGFGPVVRQTTK